MGPRRQVGGRGRENRHGAPHLVRHRIPLMSCRLLHFGGRPAFFPRGSSGASRAHWASVRSARLTTTTLGTRSPVLLVLLRQLNHLPETSPSSGHRHADADNTLPPTQLRAPRSERIANAARINKQAIYRRCVTTPGGSAGPAEPATGANCGRTGPAVRGSAGRRPRGRGRKYRPG
jgi:hypothetical protein